jgi:hypothetical protein
MNAQRDDAKRLRVRDATLGNEFSQTGRDPSLGMPCILVQTTTVKTYPTSAQSFYACLPLTVLGAEVEGGAGSITPGSSTFFALNLGSAVPPVGTHILATFVESRWVFRYDG